ncbi:MAG: HDOD domain-containing protein, partial [Azoarcus sp.]|nr:HDOD domain-containing protein [Azoarcus sp.]
MLKSLFRSLFRRPPRPEKNRTRPSKPKRTVFDAPLSRIIPSRQEQALNQPVVSEGIETGIICREAVLDRQQKIAGYQFMLQESAHSRIHIQSRTVFNFFSEILIRNLVRTNIFPLLGRRLVFIEIPISFLDHPCLADLPANNTVLILKPIETPEPPDESNLLAKVKDLRATGFRIGIPDPLEFSACFCLMQDVDLISLPCPEADFKHTKDRVDFFSSTAPKAAILMRNLPGMEDFNFCYKIGASLFQGSFIVSREDWKEVDLGSSFAHLTMLLKKARQDADTREIAALIKQDPAITLRLLRYINSAANGLRNPVSSIEHALALFGRAPLQRWLMLLIYSSKRSNPRTDAVLETALVRARFMELISSSRPPPERESIFLTGLLSLVDVVLQQPIGHALEILSIDREIRNAILLGQGPYAPALTLAQACETMDPTQVISKAVACHIDP